MAVYTLLDREIISRLLDFYEIGVLDAFEPVSSGIENTNYFVWARSEGSSLSAWVLTVFENLHEEQLPFFNSLTRYLSSEGFPVPAPLLMKGGADYFCLSEVGHTEPGDKCGVLVPRLAGKAKDQHTLDECRQVAGFVARMHRALETFPALQNVDHDPAWFEGRVKQLQAHLNKPDTELLEQAWHRYQTCIDKLSACPSGIIHGDLFRDNVLFDEQGISGVIDFYHAGFSPLLFDLAVVANDWAVLQESAGPSAGGGDHSLQEAKVYDESKLDALIQAYAKVRPLVQMEKELWPRFLEMAAFRFWLSRLKTLYQPGYQEHIKQGDCVKSPDAMKRILQAAMLR